MRREVLVVALVGTLTVAAVPGCVEEPDLVPANPVWVLAAHLVLGNPHFLKGRSLPIGSKLTW